MVQRFDVGTRLSEMAVHNGVCYLAGQVAPDGTQDIGGQTRQVLTAIDALLQRAGTESRIGQPAAGTHAAAAARTAASQRHHDGSRSHGKHRKGHH